MKFKDGLIVDIEDYLNNRIVQDEFSKDIAVRERLYSDWKVNVFKVNYDNYNQNFRQEQLTDSNLLHSITLDIKSLLYSFAEFPENHYKIDDDFNIEILDYSNSLFFDCKYRRCFCEYPEIDEALEKLEENYFRDESTF